MGTKCVHVRLRGFTVYVDVVQIQSFKLCKYHPIDIIMIYAFMNIMILSI